MLTVAPFATCVAFLASVHYVLAQSSTIFTLTITPSTCASPSGYSSCKAQSDATFNKCVANAGQNNDQIAACACVATLDTINCALTDCWNVVYGCEYQYLANQYVTGCASPVPFFPAPDNVPGGCVCNLGYISYNTTAAAIDYKNCITADVERNDGCACCFQAAGYAALYSMCPTTNPAFSDYPSEDSASGVFDVMDPNLKNGQCVSLFQKYDCQSLGYTGFGVPFMTSVNTATFGSGSLTNSNTKTLASPASGSVFTWTDLNIAYTITAAKNNGGAAASSSSGKASSSATATTGSVGAGSGSASAATATATAAATSGSSQSSSTSKSSAACLSVSNTIYLTILSMWSVLNLA